MFYFFLGYKFATQSFILVQAGENKLALILTALKTKQIFNIQSISINALILKGIITTETGAGLYF